MPRSCRIVLRTAASTSTARLRPASTAITILRTGTSRISSLSGSYGRRSNSRSIVSLRTRWTISFRRIFRRTAVSPKIALMSSRPMPRTSSRFSSSSGQRPFERGLRDAVEVDRVVGHQAVAARDQLEAELALAEARLAGQQHAEAEDVHEDAVARRALGEVLAEVAAHDVDHVAGRFAR